MSGVSSERPGGVRTGGSTVGGMSSPALSFSRREIRFALGDPAVVRAVWRAVRDVRLRAAFRTARERGEGAEAVIEALCGPHVDEQGRTYFLSEESVRRIVYRKGAARRAASGEA